MKQRGFTLVEVLVALGIVAVTLTAGLQATAALTRQAQRQSDRLLAQTCAENELIKVRLTKQLMKRQLGQAIASQMAEEGRIFAERLQSGEAKEAMTAFFEKRKPDFSRF